MLVKPEFIFSWSYFVVSDLERLLLESVHVEIEERKISRNETGARSAKE